MSEKQSWSAKSLPLRPMVAFIYVQRGLPIEKYLGPTTISARKKYSIGGIEIMNKKKHTRSEQKKAWDCYVRRLTLPIAIHRPTKEEKEMLRKAGYIIK